MPRLRRSRGGPPPITLPGALLAATVAASCPARADPPAPAASTAPPDTARLAWVRMEGAEACPGVADMVARVARLLGRDPFSDAAPRTIEGVVARDPGGAGWTARLYVRDASGAAVGASELRSAAAGCDSIGTAAAIAMALAIDPTAQLRPEQAPAAAGASAPAASSSASAPAAASAPAVPRPTAAPRAAPPRALLGARAAAPWERGGDLTAQFVVGFGLLPQPAPGVALAASAHLARRWSVSAGALLLPEVTAAAPAASGAPPDASYAFGLAAAWGAGCFDAVHLPWLSVEACAGLLVGAAHAVVSRAMAEVPGNVPYLGLTAGPRVTVRVVGPLLLELAAEGVWSAMNYRFTLRHYVNGTLAGSDTVFAQPDLAAVLHLGVGAHFW